MRKIRDNFARANNVIQSDKSVMSEGCKSLVLQDFAKTFEEYFELNGPAGNGDRLRKRRI